MRHRCSQLATASPSEHDFHVLTRYQADGDPPFAGIEDVLRRYGIDGSAAYSRNGVVVGATLDADELATIRRDPQVEYVERDCLDHVARYFRNLGPDRIVGSYIVSCVDGTELSRLVARYDVASLDLFEGFGSFAAELSDAERDRLRHDAEVEYVQDDAWEYAL